MDSPIPIEKESTETETSTESSEDVKQSTIELVEKHKSRKQRSDKGIPRGPRGSSPQAVQAQNIDPTLQLNLELVKKSIAALVKTGDAIVVRRVYSRARRLGCDDALAKEYALTIGLTQDETQIISECTSVIFARSEWLIAHAPEVMLACVAISYTTRTLTVLSRLYKIEEEMKEREKKKV